MRATVAAAVGTVAKVPSVSVEEETRALYSCQPRFDWFAMAIVVIMEVCGVCNLFGNDNETINQH